MEDRTDDRFRLISMQVLGASLNMFLNQNAKEVISELRSDLEYGLADIFTGLWNNVFSKLPIKLWLQ